MIRVTVSENNGITGVRLKGHAGFEGVAKIKSGGDIVCAAASCLTCTFLEKLRETGMLEKQSVMPGDTVFTYRKEGAESYADFYITGLKMIEEQYPENIKIMVGAE